jgi:hypothetical protein
MLLVSVWMSMTVTVAALGRRRGNYPNDKKERRAVLAFCTEVTHCPSCDKTVARSEN